MSVNIIKESIRCVFFGFTFSMVGFFQENIFGLHCSDGRKKFNLCVLSDVVRALFFSEFFVILPFLELFWYRLYPH